MYSSACATAPRVARRGIVAGAKWSTTLLMLAICRTVDAFGNACPHTVLRVYVDEFILQACGASETVARSAAGAAAQLIHTLERDVELIVAPDTLVAYASSQALADDLARQCAPRGMRSARAGTHRAEDAATGGHPPPRTGA